MKETAINSIYIIMHCVGENMVELNGLIRAEKGYIWEVYFRKDVAEKEACNLNADIKPSIYLKHRFIVLERPIY